MKIKNYGKIKKTLCTFYEFTIKFKLFKLYFSFDRSRKSTSPFRTREGPVTRLSNAYVEKDEKVKSEQNEEEDDNSRESEKPENNDNSDNEENDVCI